MDLFGLVYNLSYAIAYDWSREARRATYIANIPSNRIGKIGDGVAIFGLSWFSREF